METSDAAIREPLWPPVLALLAELAFRHHGVEPLGEAVQSRHISDDLVALVEGEGQFEPLLDALDDLVVPPDRVYVGACNLVRQCDLAWVATELLQ